MTSHILKVTISDTQPAIWRRLRIDSDKTLGDLHVALQACFGWSDSHRHEFFAYADRYGVPDLAEPDDEDMWDETDQVIRHVVPCDNYTMEYSYDGGDGWQLSIDVERIEAGAPSVDPKAPRAVFVSCVDGARAAPPQDCGGPSGYATLLAALKDPTHSHYCEIVDWVGSDFQPDSFSLVETNRSLAALRAPWCI